MTEETRPTLSILYHGNCIDGWFSAYIIYLAKRDTHEVNFFPISPNVPRSWPKKDKICGHHIILTDVSVPEYILGEWEDVTESIFCIDHHTSSEKTWKGHEDISVHCTEWCASVLAWRHFFPDEKEPDWLMQIDRIDRWVDVTDDDRAMRELMMPIAHKAVESSCIEALDETLGYTQCYGMRDQYRLMLAQGHEILALKEAHLAQIMRKGRIVTITSENKDKWGLSDDWVGAKGFVIDTTGQIIDSTAMGYMALTKYKEIKFFANYRKKERVRFDEKKEIAYTYSVRSRPEFNLTSGNVFHGHESSAGATLLKNRDKLPFIAWGAK